MSRITSFLSVYGPWIALYIVLFTGAGIVGATAYHKYETHHLRVPGSVQLLVNKTRYQLGERIEFTVTNHFPVPIYVTNGCPKEPLDVYRWDNAAWRQIHATAQDDAECQKEARNVAIPPEASRTYNFDDWPTLFAIPGVYRIATHIDHYDDVPFQDFVVLEPAKVINLGAVSPQPADAAAAASAPVADEAVTPVVPTEQSDIVSPEGREHEGEQFDD